MPARSQRVGSNLDGLTVALFLMLAALGWWNLVSAASGPDGDVLWSLSTLHGKQALWLLVSLIIGALIIQVEGEFFIRTAWLNYAIQIGLCALVLVVGKKVGGARSWFGVGGFGIQPSEFAKLGTSMALAWYLGTRDGWRDWPRRFRSLAIVGLPAGLILLQPDAGTVLGVPRVCFCPLSRRHDRCGSDCRLCSHCVGGADHIDRRRRGGLSMAGPADWVHCIRGGFGARGGRGQSRYCAAQHFPDIGPEQFALPWRFWSRVWPIHRPYTLRWRTCSDPTKKNAFTSCLAWM